MTPKPPNIDEALWAEIAGGSDRSRADAAIRLAALERGRGRQQLARELLAAATFVPDREGGARVWLALAELQAELGAEAESLRAYRRAAELADAASCPDVVVDLAARAERHGNPAGAARLYEAVLDAGADPAAVAVAAARIASICCEQGDVARAVRMLRRAREAAGPDLRPEIEVELAEALLADPDRAAAAEVVALLESVVIVDHPDLSPRAALMLARFLGGDGRFVAAHELLGAVIESRHPDFRETAEAEVSALMHEELTRSIGPAQQIAAPNADRSALLPEVCLSSERRIEPPARSYDASGTPHPIARFLCEDEREEPPAEPGCGLWGCHPGPPLVDVLIRRERQILLYTMNFDARLDLDVEISLPRMLRPGAGAARNYSGPSALCGGALAWFRRFRNGGAPQMPVDPARQIIHWHGGGLEPGEPDVRPDLGPSYLPLSCLAGPLQLDLGTALAHGLSSGAGVAELNVLFLALVDYRRGVDSGLLELGLRDPSRAELLCERAPVLSSAAVRGPRAEPDPERWEWLGLDRLGALVSRRWDPLTSIDEQESRLRPTERIVEAAICGVTDNPVGEPGR